MRRRGFLGAFGTGVTGLAGCLSSSGGAGEDVLRVETLDVAGSPGGTMPVRKPGSVTLLDFWATWCAPCKPQMAELRNVHESFPDVHMLSITNENDEAAVREFWKEYKGTWPVAIDTELKTNDKYDATRVPTLIVIDSEGEETWRHVGLAAADTIAAELEAAMR